MAAPIGDGDPRRAERAQARRALPRPRRALGHGAEEGRSAIAAAARAIADFRLGRSTTRRPRTWASSAAARRATSSPTWCVVEAEARSHDEAKLADLVQEMLEPRRSQRASPGARSRPRSRRATAATASGGTTRRAHRGAGARAGRLRGALGLTGGAADANAFNARGLRCVNLANGMAEIHTPDEHIAVADLEAMVDVTLGLVEAARDAALSLRRGVVSADPRAPRRARAARGRRHAVRRLPAAHRRGRGGRRRARQRAGAAARARLGRLRRGVREPDARASGLPPEPART